MNAIVTSAFNDSLELRARNLRFRGVGNPYAFLDELGIIPIKEFLYRGATIIELAEALNLPLHTIHVWIEQNNYQPDIEEASVISAEGYLWRGQTLLNQAENKFQLDKAKLMLEHGRFMASKKNKKVYGNTQDVGSGAASVTYVFNVGEAPPVVAESKKVDDAIEAEFEEVPRVSMDFNLGPAPEHIRKAGKIAQPIAPVEREHIPEQDQWLT